MSKRTFYTILYIYTKYMYTVYELYISSYHGEVKLLHEVCNIFVTFFVDFTYEISYELRTLYAYIYIYI